MDNSDLILYQESLKTIDSLLGIFASQDQRLRKLEVKGKLVHPVRNSITLTLTSIKAELALCSTPNPELVKNVLDKLYELAREFDKRLSKLGS